MKIKKNINFNFKIIIIFVLIISFHLILITTELINKTTQLFNKSFKTNNNITLIKLSNIFNINQVLEENVRKINQNFGEINSSKIVATYRDIFIRLKIFPLAAAAYGNDQNIKECTDSFWQLNHEVWQTVFRKKVPSVFGFGHVAYYFDNIFYQLDKKGVTEEIFWLIKKYPDYELWITGHSLGGALAAIAAAKIVKSKAIKPELIKLVTFGQPRTGDSGFAYNMDRSLSFFNYRVTRSRDVVVHLPPRSFEDYAHYKTEIFYDNKMNPGDKWIRCVKGDEDINCANRYKQVLIFRFVYTINDHTNYFGKDVSKYGLNGCYGG